MYLFLERGGEREKEREGKHQCVRESPISCPSHVPQPGTGPTTQARALSRNGTSNLLLGRTILNQMSHASEGYKFFFKILFIYLFIYF